MMKFYQFFLLPFSFVYGIVMMIRNGLFDHGLIRSRRFDIPVISVGNLSFGGTGKTPHIEYIIRLIKDRYQTATLSRGYGRSSTGFIIASKRSAYKYIGDEPLQYAKKYEEIKVAVDEDRVDGIEKLIGHFPTLDVVLLDDAFQHRQINAGLSILLTDFHQLYTDDFVFPSGTLREFCCGSKRADIIVVTKSPKILSPISRRRILEELRPKEGQKVFFSYIRYCEPVLVTHSSTTLAPYGNSVILLFTGIANDYPIREHLKRHCRELEVIQFCDHHPYTLEDLRKIKTRFDSIPTRKKVIFTTEKDILRIKTPEFLSFTKRLPLFYLPIEVEFHGEDKSLFNDAVLDYIGQNRRLP